jgi:hypothetical protein
LDTGAETDQKVSGGAGRASRTGSVPVVSFCRLSIFSAQRKIPPVLLGGLTSCVCPSYILMCFFSPGGVVDNGGPP